MLVAGIVDKDNSGDTANLINSFLSMTGKKVSIADSKDFLPLNGRMIKNYIWELEKNNSDILILKIDLDDVVKEAFKHLQFDVMIFTDKADYNNRTDSAFPKSLLSKLLSLAAENGTAIVNVDDTELIKFLQDMKFNTITYGFNSKASITTSSIGDSVYKNNMLCCLQKAIPAKNGMLIEPQEYMININSGETDMYDVLAAASFAIVNGVDLNQICQ